MCACSSKTDCGLNAESVCETRSCERNRHVLQVPMTRRCPDTRMLAPMQDALPAEISVLVLVLAGGTHGHHMAPQADVPCKKIVGRCPLPFSGTDAGKARRAGLCRVVALCLSRSLSIQSEKHAPFTCEAEQTCLFATPTPASRRVSSASLSASLTAR